MNDFWQNETPQQKLDRLVMNCEELLQQIENTDDEEYRNELQEQYDDWAEQADKAMREANL